MLNWWALLSVLTRAASTLTVISIFVLGTWLYQQGFTLNNFGYGAAIAAVIFVVTMLTGTAQLIYTRRRRVQF